MRDFFDERDIFIPDSECESVHYMMQNKRTVFELLSGYKCCVFIRLKRLTVCNFDSVLSICYSLSRYMQSVDYVDISKIIIGYSKSLRDYRLSLKKYDNYVDYLMKQTEDDYPSLSNTGNIFFGIKCLKQDYRTAMKLLTKISNIVYAVYPDILQLDFFHWKESKFDIVCVEHFNKKEDSIEQRIVDEVYASTLQFSLRHYITFLNNLCEIEKDVDSDYIDEFSKNVKNRYKK